MEFLFGFVVAFATLLFIKRFLITDNVLESKMLSRIKYSQSHIFSLIAPSIPYMPVTRSFTPTQAFLNDQKNNQRVILTEDRAYWIKDNTFYEAQLVDGEVDKNTTKVVDTLAMDKVELDKMAFIVQKLTEGTRNDFGNPGIGRV
jgi:lipopolysaccharide export LptBFGC system permease protein LptF